MRRNPETHLLRPACSEEGQAGQEGSRQTRQRGRWVLLAPASAPPPLPAAPLTCGGDSLNVAAAAAPEAATASPPSARLAGSGSIVVAATGLLALARENVMADSPFPSSASPPRHGPSRPSPSGTHPQRPPRAAPSRATAGGVGLR